MPALCELHGERCELQLQLPVPSSIVEPCGTCRGIHSNYPISGRDRSLLYKWRTLLRRCHSFAKDGCLGCQPSRLRVVLVSYTFPMPPPVPLNTGPSRWRTSSTPLRCRSRSKAVHRACQYTRLLRRPSPRGGLLWTHRHLRSAGVTLYRCAPPTSSCVNQ